MFKETDAEIWKDIDGLEGEYAISSKGNFKNLNTGRLLVGGYDGGGYKQVVIKGKAYRIHRLVALAFIPNPQNLPQVNHRDENKENNNVENLEWCTASYNTNYSSHKRSCKVKQIDKDGNLIRIWNSFHEIEKELGYHRSAIREVSKGKLRYAYGFRWEYVNRDTQRIMNRPIIVYKGSEFIGQYASTSKAAEALGLIYGCINNCLRGCIPTLKGYTFKYAE